jgi:hypothetical protein
MYASGANVVGSPQSNAVFLRSGATSTVVAHGGDAIPSGGTWIVPTSPQPLINDAGQIAFGGLISAPPSAIVAYLRDDGGTFTQVIHHGDPAPDQNGTFDLVQAAGVLHAPGLSEDGELAFVAAVAVAAGNPATQGIFRATDADHVVQIARRGQASPDGNGSILGFDLDAIDVVPVNDAGQTAFQATLTATTHGTADDLAVFRGDGGALLKVARKGETSPDGDGAFADFDHPALNAAGQVAFHATLSGTAHTQGIYLYDDDAGLVPVARLGGALLGQSIVSLRFAHDTSRGRTHVGLNADGQVAFQFDLSDGRRGVAVWTMDTGTTTSTTSVGSTSTTATSTTTSTTGVTPTSIPGRGGTTTLPGASSTTTTLPPCDSVRCIVGDASGGECADETLPSSVTTKLDRAAQQADQAPLQSAKKARRLYTSAKRLLGKAGKAATKASRGRHPKISAGCATGVVGVVQRATAVLNGGLTK